MIVLPFVKRYIEIMKMESDNIRPRPSSYALSGCTSLVESCTRNAEAVGSIPGGGTRIYYCRVEK